MFDAPLPTSAKAREDLAGHMMRGEFAVSPPMTGYTGITISVGGGCQGDH